MILKDYLKGEKGTIALLTLDNIVGLGCMEFSPKEFKNIPKDLLKSEVMEVIDEDEVKEVWVRVDNTIYD